MFLATAVICGLTAQYADPKYLTNGCGVSFHKKMFVEESQCQDELLKMGNFYKKLPPNAYLADLSCHKVTDIEGSKPNL